MNRNKLPKGLDHKDIWASFQEAHLPAPCEHCGKEASSKSLMVSRKHWQMDLCASCRHKKYQGILGDPKEDVEAQSILDEYGDRPDLPF